MISLAYAMCISYKVHMMQELDYIRCGDYFCFVGGGETVSRACTGKKMASSCCTSGWNRAHTNGRALNPR